MTGLPVSFRTATHSVATLFPGYFALVMASGILGIACQMQDWRPLAWAFLAVNLIAYPALWLLTLLRLLRWPRKLLADLVDHKRGPGFFTSVAATSVLGNQLVLLTGDASVGLPLWALALALWLVLTYVFFLGVVVSTSKWDIEEALSGGWLLAAVATQSLAVLGTLVASASGASQLIVLASLLLWLLGSMQYLLLIAPIFHRLIFLRMSAEARTPLFWINSGALAITTLAGSHPILTAGSLSFIGDVMPFVKGFTLFFWVAATWWIPLLALVGVWRHVWKRYPLAYAPEYWGLVFPLGMYTVCSLQMPEATGLTPLQAVARVTIWLTLLAWGITFVGLLRRLRCVVMS